MDDKISKLIVSNNNDKEENSIVYVHLNHLFEYKRQYNYLTFSSDIWKKDYFLPLGHMNTHNNTISRLNTFNLVEENLGINLEEILRKQGLSVYAFLNKNYKIISEHEFYNDTFVVKTSEFLHTTLDIPIENSVRILKWVHSANYVNQPHNQLLLTTIKIENT